MTSSVIFEMPMRAARLLRLLILLQNRGRQTSRQLADELEVTPRTILRDVDAMTEAGLPILVHQGNQGGIALGFNYRTRLTGLSQDEAKALGLILAADTPMIAALGLEAAAKQARAKLIESLPDTTRAQVEQMTTQFQITPQPPPLDARITALARAVQARTGVRLRYGSATQQMIHPVAMDMTGDIWRVQDARTQTWIARPQWGRVNISAKRFASE
ncbi:MAG: helix-turn-helix transcriptional regulator [Paracoccaceae bacterium]